MERPFTLGFPLVVGGFDVNPRYRAQLDRLARALGLEAGASVGAICLAVNRHLFAHQSK